MSEHYVSEDSLCTTNKLASITAMMQSKNMSGLKVAMKNVFEQNILDDALQASVKYGYIEGIQLLLECGADARANNSAALIECATMGMCDAFKLLVAYGADMCTRANTALCTSVAYGHVDMVTMLLENGVDANATGYIFSAPQDQSFPPIWQTVNEGYPLHISVNKRCVPIVKLLIQYGADVRAFDDYALRASAEYGDTELVKLFLEYGADVHAKYDAALECAAHNNHLDTIKILILAGAKIDICRNMVVRKVAEWGDAEMYQFLIDHGADIYNESGLSRVRNTHMLKFIFEQNISDDEYIWALCSFITDNNIEFVDALLSNGVRPRPCGENNDPLISTCYFGNIEIVNKLLQYDAHLYCDIDAALNCNVFHGNYEVVVILVAYGGNLEAEGNIMLRAVKSKNARIVELLLDNNIKPNEETLKFIIASANIELFEKMLANHYNIDDIKVALRACSDIIFIDRCEQLLYGYN